jgi:hypothetical protein
VESKACVVKPDPDIVKSKPTSTVDRIKQGDVFDQSLQEVEQSRAGRVKSMPFLITFWKVCIINNHLDDVEQDMNYFIITPCGKQRLQSLQQWRYVINNFNSKHLKHSNKRYIAATRAQYNHYMTVIDVAEVEWKYEKKVQNDYEYIERIWKPCKFTASSQWRNKIK